MTLTEKLSIDLIHALRPVVAALRTRHHAALADQLERAGTSVALNTAEAGGRAGRDSVRVLRIALGECREVRVRNQVAGRPDSLQQIAQQHRVSLRRTDQHGRWLRDDDVDVLERPIDGQRAR